MVFKDTAGTVMAQRELAKQEKQILQTLQNMITIQNNSPHIGTVKAPFDVEVYPAPDTTVQVKPLYKPQDMHCLKKLLEQEYDGDYAVPKHHVKPLYKPQDMHCLKKLLEQEYPVDYVGPIHPYMTSTNKEDPSYSEQLEDIKKKKEKLEKAIFNLQNFPYKLLSEINEDYEESDDNMGTLEDILNLNASYPG